ncbi:MAG: glycosyltransferase family 2 protein [Planctomycetaceae bacterium]|nr:glycosyltransferase family 2 protein [Planctomycetaceae bacterium]
MKLEIVTHCWRYSRLLHYQLSSLYLFPPTVVQVMVCVYCADREHDPLTADVLDFFRHQQAPPTVVVDVRQFEPPRLFRRAIGRHHAARRTTADWVWFTDCDMVFRDGAIDSLADHLEATTERLLYPRQVMLHRTHALGDAAIERAKGAKSCLDIDPSEFKPKQYSRAIGGVQIVLGSVVREFGYCPEERWQRPADRWQRCTEDTAFRKRLGTKGTSIDVPNVFRMRHSECGREVTGLQL